MQRAAEYFNEHFPNGAQQLREGYDWVAERVQPLWDKITPAIPPVEEIDRCFTMGYAFEEEHFGNKQEPSPQEAVHQVAEVLLNATSFAQNTLRRMGRISLAPETAMTVLERMYDRIDPNESPLAGAVRAAREQIKGFKEDDPEVVQVSARWLLLSVHAGRESYRRHHHLVNNLRFAARWVILWGVMSSLHPWARNIGLLCGFAAAIGVGAKFVEDAEWNGRIKGRCEGPNALFGGVRSALNADIRITHMVTVGAVSLWLWTKLGLPAPSPLLSSILTFVIAGGAGHYLGTPIVRP
ncbi:MAG: hypothetical protein AB7F31_06500 [Parachlamydiales bacterium]